MTLLPRYEGGRISSLWLLAVGVVSLALTALGAWSGGREALFGYLFAFTYWVGLCVGSLILLATFLATGARWSVVLHRALALIGACVPMFALLFLPVALGLGELFPWVRPQAGMGDEALALLAHKRPYLNPPFFFARAAFYFLSWSVVSLLLLRWSRRLDMTGELRLLAWQRRLACVGLPVIGLALSFAATDWMMSLEPLWESSAYGVYVFSGAFVGAISLLGLLGATFRGVGAFGSVLLPAHFQRLGTLLFAFICFWAYIAFSQFMLIWIAGIPAEGAWYLVRLSGDWGALAAVVAVGNFVLPFFALLSRRLKQRPAALAVVCGWLLLIHALDTYWLVLPALHPGAPALHWTSLTAFVGIGALLGAAGLWLAHGDYMVPVRDPYVLHSLDTPLP